MEITKSEEQTKIEEKWTESKGSVRNYQVDQHTHCESHKIRKEKASERIFEEIMTEIFPNMMKHVDIDVQEAQWTPNKMNAESHTHTCYNHTFDRKTKHLESSKREVPHHIQGILNKI